MGDAGGGLAPPVDEEAWHRTIMLPASVLAESPSAKAGIDPEVEKEHRAWGCELAQEAGILLRCPQVVMCTSQTLLQRFYYRRPLTRFDAISVAMACTLLAMKLEEAVKARQRVATDVALVFYRLYQRRRGLPAEDIDPDGRAIAALKEEMVRLEGYLLRELGFGFYNVMDHPHKFIMYYLRPLELGVEATQKTWNYLNDALRTDVCLRHRSEVIACAAIYMAARAGGVVLPENPPWWSLFNAELGEMARICSAILALYTRPKRLWLEPLARHSVFGPGGAVRVCDSAVSPTDSAVSPTDSAVSPRYSAVSRADVGAIAVIDVEVEAQGSGLPPARAMELAAAGAAEVVTGLANAAGELSAELSAERQEEAAAAAFAGGEPAEDSEKLAEDTRAEAVRSPVAAAEAAQEARATTGGAAAAAAAAVAAVAAAVAAASQARENGISKTGKAAGEMAAANGSAGTGPPGTPLGEARELERDDRSDRGDRGGGSSQGAEYRAGNRGGGGGSPDRRDRRRDDRRDSRPDDRRDGRADDGWRPRRRSRSRSRERRRDRSGERGGGRYRGDRDRERDRSRR